MDDHTRPKAHLHRPLRRFVIGALLWALAVVALFALLERYAGQSPLGRSLLGAAPGAAIAVWLYLLYDYLRHYDEMLRALLLKAMAFSALVGVATLFTSVVRAQIAGIDQLDDTLIMTTMVAAFIASAIFFKWRHR